MRRSKNPEILAQLAPPRQQDGLMETIFEGLPCGQKSWLRYW
jgi:hypothetical protein